MDNQRHESNGASGSFARLMFIVVLVFMVIVFFKLIMNYNDKKAELDTLKTQGEAYARRIELLEDELAAPFSRDYIIKIAKNKLNLSLPQEIIIYSGLNK